MRRIFLLAAFSMLLFNVCWGQSRTALDDKTMDVERWIKRQFGRGHVPPFSFLYDGEPSAKLLPKWKHSMQRWPTSSATPTPRRGCRYSVR